MESDELSKYTHNKRKSNCAAAQKYMCGDTLQRYNDLFKIQPNMLLTKALSNQFDYLALFLLYRNAQCAAFFDEDVNCIDKKM